MSHHDAILGSWTTEPHTRRHLVERPTWRTYAYQTLTNPVASIGTIAAIVAPYNQAKAVKSVASDVYGYGHDLYDATRQYLYPKPNPNMEQLPNASNASTRFEARGESRRAASNASVG